MIPTEEVAAAMSDEEFDIRPRDWDHISQQWMLVDTGSQVSVIAPSATDTVNPRLRLETVDGSHLPCYGKKAINVRLGRKQY